MDFLYELYNNEYFGIGLFIAVTILTFSFLIILFFGKKDEKVHMNTVNNERIIPNEAANKEAVVVNDNVDLLNTAELDLGDVVESREPSLESSVLREDVSENIFSDEYEEPRTVSGLPSSGPVLNEQIYEENTPIIEEPRVIGAVSNSEPNVYREPTRPEFSLPKRVDLPKLRADRNNNSIISSSFKEEVSHQNSPFLNLEDESYTIEK